MKHVIALVALMVSAWSASPLCAQTATASEWFDRAAQQFVQQDKITALRTLDQGLREHPNDPRLTKLAEALLKEDKQQQQQQQQQQQGGNNDQQQQQQSQQQAQEQRSQEQQQAEQQQGTAGQENRKAGQMDPRDAKRLLDALQRGEKDVQQKVRLRQRPAQRVTIDKDW
ncbi:MAG: hypothetical protein JNL52_06825 [Flavobacteriales bacterium]|nr:hypothetical protein [Flavobacteriales bacterium]